MNAFFKRLSQSNEPTLGTEVHHLLADYGNKKLSANKGEAFQEMFYFDQSDEVAESVYEVYIKYKDFEVKHVKIYWSTAP